MVQFKPSRDASLVFRLKAICAKEALKVDDHTLSVLVQMADGDVRCCLNTLQLARSRSGELSHEALLAMPVGHRDVAKGALDLWKQVFVLPSPGSAGSAPRAQARPARPKTRTGGAKAAEFYNPRQTALFAALNRADVGRVIDGALLAGARDSEAPCGGLEPRVIWHLQDTVLLRSL